MKNEIIHHKGYVEIKIGTRQGVVSAFVDTADFEDIDVEGSYVIFKDKKGRPLARGCKLSGQKFIHKHIVGNLSRSHTLVFKNDNSLDYRRHNLQIVDKDGTITEVAPVVEKPKSATPPQKKAKKAAKPQKKDAAPQNTAVDQDPDRVRGKPKEKRSDVPGVYHHKASDRWHAAGFHEGKRWSLGYFKEQLDAELEIGIFRTHGPHYAGLKRNQGVNKK